MNITTWNVNSVRRRLERVLEWVDEHEPDVLCMQELKCQDGEFPIVPLAARGYTCSVFGQKNWNGVAIVSHRDRAPHDEVVLDFPMPGDGQARGIACTIRAPGQAPLRLVNLYVVNGGELDSDKYEYKLKWLDGLVAWAAAERARWAGPMIVCGDFNLVPGDLDVYDPKAWAGQVLCTDAERRRFQALLDLGFVESWRALHPDVRSYSFFDYRGAAFDRNEGLRIDHHLVSGLPVGPAIAAGAGALIARPTEGLRVIDVHIDHDARARPETTDHAPVTLFLA